MATALVSVALMTGCASEAAGSDDPVFAEIIETAIADAQSGGASDRQLAILEEARESGEVTIEQMREASRATVECMVDSGLDAEYQETTEPHGLVVPGYRVRVIGEVSESQQFAADRCDDEHGLWVNMVYQGQPSSDRLWDELYNSRVDVIRACLEDAGYETEPDATGVELARQVGEIFGQTLGDVNCMDSTVSG